MSCTDEIFGNDKVPASVSEPGQETETEFLARLARITAEAEAKPAGGATTPAKPVNLADEMRHGADVIAVGAVN